MTNKEILKQYLGDEVFEKFKRNFDKKHAAPYFSWEKTPSRIIDYAFRWSETLEGYDFWHTVYISLSGKHWNDLLTRQISKEEHKLLLQMFVCGYMGWMAPEEQVDYDMCMEESTLFKRIFDLVWEE